MAAGIDLQQLLEKASKVSEQAEVFHLDHKDEPVMFESNRLKLVEARESSGVAVRLIKDGRIGLASTSNFQDLDSLVNNALEMVTFGPEAKLDLPSHSSFTEVDVYDEAAETFPMEDMIRMGQEGIDLLRQSDGELVCDATVSKSKNVITILNSKGGSASYSKTTFSAFYHGTKIQGTDMLFVSDGREFLPPILEHLRVGGVGETAAGIFPGACARPHGEPARHLHLQGSGRRIAVPAPFRLQRARGVPGYVATGGQAGREDGWRRIQCLGPADPSLCRGQPHVRRRGECPRATCHL